MSLYSYVNSVCPLSTMSHSQCVALQDLFRAHGGDYAGLWHLLTQKRRTITTPWHPSKWGGVW